MSQVTIQSIAANQAKADAAFEGTSFKTAQAVARIMGENPTYETWESVRLEYRAAYIAAAKCGENTADKSWSRVSAKMADEFDLEKPKAPTKAAAAKAEQRSKAADVAATLTGTLEERLQQAAALPAKGRAGVVSALLKEADKAASEADKAAKAKTKALADTLAKRLKEADYATLLAVEALLDKAAKA